MVWPLDRMPRSLLPPLRRLRLDRPRRPVPHLPDRRPTPPVKRSGPPERRTPLRSRQRLPNRSKRRVSESRQRSETIQAVVARDGRRCWAADLVPEVECWGPLDADEYDLRSARPGGHLDPTNVQLLCRLCHSAKHALPKHSAVLGLRPYPTMLGGELLGSSGPTPELVREALRQFSAFKARAMPGGRLLPDSALARAMPYALRAAAAAWERWCSDTRARSRE